MTHKTIVAKQDSPMMLCVDTTPNCEPTWMAIAVAAEREDGSTYWEYLDKPIPCK